MQQQHTLATILAVIAPAWVLGVFFVFMRFGGTKVDLPDRGATAMPGQILAAADSSAKVMDGREIFTHEVVYPNSTKTQCRIPVYFDDRGAPVPHGTAEGWHEHGSKMYKGRWQHGERTEKWTAWHPNGRVWVEGEFKDGQPVGAWQYRNENGDVAGIRIDGLRQGHWRGWNLRRDCFGEGDYLDDKMHGTWVFKDVNGHAFLTADFDQGVLDGDVAVQHLAEYHFVFDSGVEVDGKRWLKNGDQQFAADDSRYAHLMDSIPAPKFELLRWIPEDGPFDPPHVETVTENWPDGTPKKKIQYKWVCQPRHALTSREPVRVRHGTAEQWWQNGERLASQSYLDGVPDGPFLRWYENGQQEYQIQFRLGQPVGTWEFWHASGKKKAEGSPRGRLRPETWTFWNTAGDRVPMPDLDEWLKDNV